MIWGVGRVISRGSLVLLFTFSCALAGPRDGATRFATGPNSGSPREIALGHLGNIRNFHSLKAADLAGMGVRDEYRSGRTGTSHVYLQQRVNGLEVFGAVAHVNVAKDGSVINSASAFVPDVQGLANDAIASLSASDALRAALDHLGIATKHLPAVKQAAVGMDHYTLYDKGTLSILDIPVRLIYQPDGKRKSVRLAWSVEIYEPGAQHWWNMRIDAETGEIIGRNDYVIHDSFGHPPGEAGTGKKALAQAAPPVNSLVGDQYQVYAMPVESPNHGSRTIVQDPADPVASPFGWHDTDGSAGPESNFTVGNNVDAYQDANNSDSPTGGNVARADGGGSLHFNFAVDLGQAPSTYKDAAVANLFYWNNVIHDVFYHYGFDEAAGNFQENNYGNGGSGGDQVLAEAQDGGDFNNANFATPADGGNGRMQMYLWNSPNPDRDGDFDNGIVLHEYGHGISIRLTGGPGNSFCLNNNEQMGEGWSDWFTLMLTMEPGDTGPDRRGVGTYVLEQPTDGNGIRAFPYSTSLAIDPRTYDDIKNASVPHGVGSIWCAMLWEMTWALVDQYGFDTNFYTGTGGNNLALQLVVDGLKLQPCSPGFVDGRDAILMADQVLTGGANQCLIWEAFAKRGLGFSAAQGSSASSGDGTEAFDLPPICLLTLKLEKTASTNEIPLGQMLTYTLDVRNDTTGTLSNVIITDPIPVDTSFVPGSASDGGTAFAGVVGFPAVTLTNGESITRTFKVLLTGSDFTELVFLDDMESGTAAWEVSHNEGSLDWSLSMASARSPSNAWFALDHTSTTDQYLELTNDITVAAATVLRFWHRYDTELSYDGGLLEVSTDGSTWLDLGPQMTQNGYSGSLSLGPASGRSAFTGNSGGFVETLVDLSPYAGQDVNVRFRMSTDASIGGLGWYVDDVRFTHEVRITNTASVVAAEGDSATDRLETRVLEPIVPDFFMNASPATRDACFASSAIVTVSVNSVGGHTNPVTLSVVGEPLGTAAGFSPNPVNPTPGLSVLTINNLDSVAEGSYALFITGTSADTTRVANVQLNVTTSLSGRATLQMPTNETAGLTTTPLLAWSASPDADNYRIEIADDPAFSSLKYSATVLSTTHTVVAGLNIETSYVWRIISESVCSSTVSTTFVFETGSPPTIFVRPTSLSTTQVVDEVVMMSLLVSNASSTEVLSWAIEETAQLMPLQVLAAGPVAGASSLAEVPVDVMAPLENARLVAEDKVTGRFEKVLQFAEPIAVDITPDNTGKWEKLGNGRLLWRARVRSEGALSLNLGFSRYTMPPGGSLLLYDPAGKHVRGPFTEKDNEKHGQLWTPVVYGDEVVIEVQVPAMMPLGLELALSVVNHGYRDISASANVSGACNVDVVCGAADGLSKIDAWRSEIRSAAAYSTGGSIFCSGVLLNNTAQDLTPLFLTAAHCGISVLNAPSMVVYWNYENSTCRTPGGGPSGSPGDGSLAEFNSGAVYRAGNAASDFALVELDDPINPAFNTHWAGWDRSGAETPTSVAIHHPDGEEKRISFEDDPTTTTSYFGTSVPGDSTHVRVTDWDLGTTEPGSSGSPLFDVNHRVIGQLHGGAAACGNDESDWYGRVNVSWTGGGTSATRLSDWLDPLSSGATTLDGRDLSVNAVDWLSTSPTNGNTGSSSTTVITVTFDATGLEPGIYTAGLKILSNDPSTPELLIPLSMNVTGFDIDVEPATLHACTNDTATYDIDIEPLNGFTGTVLLAVSGVPSGASASFDTNPIEVGGAGVHPTDGHLVISQLTGVVAGGYPLQISGTDMSSAATGVTVVVLSLVDSTPAGLSLVSPTNGQTNVSVAATYAWELIGDATSYLLEVDQDATFGSPDYAVTVFDTNHVATTALDELATYYWRVTAINACGTSVSPTNVYTTGEIPTNACRSPAIAIPDNSPTGVSDALHIPVSLAIADLNVSLDITHTYVGDLKVDLRHEDSGTTVTIMDRPGVPASVFGCGSDGVSCTLDDEASLPVENECDAGFPAISGAFVPNNALSAFDGESIGGTWTLTVSDHFGADIGTLNDWCLEFALQAPPEPPMIQVQPGVVVSTQLADRLVVRALEVENLSADSALKWSIGESDVVLETFTKHGDATNHVPCVGGFAGIYPCDNVDLLGFLPLDDIGGGDGADIWGWTDPLTGKEYALMARTRGTAFVDISDPEEPLYLGNLPSHIPGDYAWRDVKTYSNHAYIVCDHSGSLDHGMQVFDLTQLRSVASPPVVFSETAHYTNFGRAHNVVIDEEQGYAYAVGCKGPGTTCGSGLHMIDIRNPTNPVFAGCFSTDGYTHDAQCVTYNGPDATYTGSEICFNCNEDTLTIVDVSAKGAPVQLARKGYAGEGYTHQGWLTEDHRYFLLDDETDEFSFGHNTRTYIWDVSDLTNPVVIGIHTAPTAAIDHNQFVKGDRVYQANYRAGLRILDLTDVGAGNLGELAYFDIFPQDDNGCSDCFNGAWGNYPFFDSGVVIISGLEFGDTSVTQGLYIVEPFPEADGQPCEQLNDVPWIGLNSTNGATSPGSTGTVSVTFDSSGLSPGVYEASLCVSSDDPASPEVAVGLKLTVSETRVLTVVSDFDRVTPSVGQHNYTDGTVIAPVVVDPVFTNGLSKHGILGWTGTGSVPPSGTGTNIGSFAITNSSLLTWHWYTNFFLDTETVGSGVVDVVDGFYLSGSATTITAVADLFYHLAQWSGDTNGATIASNLLTLTMDMPRAVTAGFAENLAPLGTPEWWLAMHGLTNGGFAAGEVADVDGDGHAAWQEFVTDTVPTNFQDVLKILATIVSNSSDQVVIEWSSKPGKLYGVDRAPSVMTNFSGIASNLVATPPTNRYTDVTATNGSSYHYQIRVDGP